MYFFVFFQRIFVVAMIQSIVAALSGFGKASLCLVLFHIAGFVIIVFEHLSTYLTTGKHPSERKHVTYAQVLKVRARFKFDEIACGNSLGDFITTHEGFRHPSYVLRPHVSLYHVTPENFIFVECKPDDNPWHVKDHVFSRIGQFRTATRVIVLPVSSARMLVKEIGGKPSERLLFIASTGRCGSTLLSRIFEETGNCVVYTEPMALCDLLRHVDDKDIPDVDSKEAEFVNTVVTLLGKSPSPQPDPKRLHVFKMQPQTTYLCGVLQRLYPEATFLFLYRDLKPICDSFLKTWVACPLLVAIALLSLLPHCAGIIHRLQVRNGYSKPNRSPPIEFYQQTSHQCYVAYLPMLAMRFYLALFHKGFRIRAIRYEDVVGDPVHAVTALLRHCELDTGSDPVGRNLEVFGEDSQENCALRKSNIQKAPRPQEWNPDEIRTLCELMQLPDLLNNNVLPGTLLHPCD